MNQHIVTLVLLAMVLIRTTGMFLEQHRRHPHHHRHRHSEHHNQKELSLRDLTLRSSRQRQVQDSWKLEDEMTDNLEDARVTYQRAKRNYDRVMGSPVHVMTINNNSRCKSKVVLDNVTDTDNPSFRMDLIHYKCEHYACDQPERKCCMQMFTSINITFTNGKQEEKKIYTGCMYTDDLDLVERKVDLQSSM